MPKRWKNREMIMAPEGDGSAGGGSGGGGSGSLLDSPGAGSEGSSKAGGADSTSGDAAKGGDPNAANNAKGNAAADWRSSLPKELQDNAGLKKFTSMEALAGAYVNAQKLIGSDKIVLPGKHATEEDWKKVYTQLGLPETTDKYEVKFKETATVDQKFAQDFKENAFKAGILPKQAQQLATWFSDLNEKAEADAVALSQKAFTEGKAELEKEWGQAYPREIARATKIISEYGGEDMLKYFNDKGLGADPKLIKLLAKVGGKIYSEDKVVGDSAQIGGKSPGDLKKEIGRLQVDPAYTDRTHPNHKAAVQEMKELFESLHSPVDKK